MGIWKEIKKTLNSTLATSGFKPLDEIIREDFYYTAGGNTLLNKDTSGILQTEEGTIGYGYIRDVYGFVSKYSGNIELTITTIANDATKSYSFEAWVTQGISDNIVATIASISILAQVTGAQTYTINLPVIAEQLYVIKGKTVLSAQNSANNYYAKITNVTIKGTKNERTTDVLGIAV